MNPYFCYIISFGVVLLTYQLQWSSVYPKLTSSLQLFLCVTFLFAAVVGVFWKKQSSNWNIKAPSIDHNIGRVTLFIYALWLLDFIYEGGVPLFKILFNQPYNYRLFGFPSVHVFTVTFSSFYTLYLFHLFLVHRRKDLLFFYLVNLLAAILIYSRAMFILNLAGSFFIFLFYLKRLPVRLLVLSPVIILCLFYLFGFFGTLRVSRETSGPYNSELFLETGQATKEFTQSFIPKEFFWSYIYITSPLANFQQNINLNPTDTLTFTKGAQLVTNEFLFDFISKRTNKLFGFTPHVEGRIPGPFNVSTIYSRSFWFLRWYGVMAMACVVLLLPLGYVRLNFSESPFFISGMAILCTMYLFMFYDNTIRFTGLGFQLVYPVLFSWLARKNIFNLRRTPEP